MQLARDASAAGDRVLAENYTQHAEHYFRVLRALQPSRPVSEIAQRELAGQGFDIDFEDETGAQAAAIMARDLEPRILAAMLDRPEAEVLPEQKSAVVEKLRAEGRADSCQDVFAFADHGILDRVRHHSLKVSRAIGGRSRVLVQA